MEPAHRGSVGSAVRASGTGHRGGNPGGLPGGEKSQARKRKVSPAVPASLKWGIPLHRGVNQLYFYLELLSSSAEGEGGIVGGRRA